MVNEAKRRTPLPRAHSVRRHGPQRLLTRFAWDEKL
jgi:hypothetical protein